MTAEDDGGLSDALTVDVTVTDVEEDGVIILSPLRGWDGTRFTADLDDGDGVSGSIDWQWARSSNRSGSSCTDIAGATGINYTATADDIGNYLRVTATYTDNWTSGNTASAILAGKIGDVRPSQNNAPAFADTTAERSIGQGTSARRAIGAPVRATDEDPDDVLKYSLSGQDAS